MKKRIEHSKDYYITVEGHVFNSKGKRLKTRISYRGYEQVTIVKQDGSRIYALVHRLVAQAFIDNPDNKPYVNHIDGNKTNNSIENLEWVTPSENMLHASHVLGVGLGENSGNAVLTEDVVHGICKLLEMGHKNIDIAKVFGIQHHNVAQIRAGAWSHISHLYSFPKRSRILSDATVRWICRKIEENLSTKQILELSTNNKITKDLIKDIRTRRVYSDISKEFAF
jgi:hypothetical protein